jgi:hypothetical protein
MKITEAGNADRVGAGEHGMTPDHFDMAPGHGASEIGGNVLDHVLFTIDERSPVELRLADGDAMSRRAFDRM